MSNDDLIADFLARGGTINKIPEKGFQRAKFEKGAIVKKRDMLAELRERAKAVQS